MTDDEIVEKAITAMTNLLSSQRELLEKKVNERSITHWIATYLQELFPEHTVDCEYNRDGVDIKRRLPTRIMSDDSDAQTVYPDIIVHRRGTHTENLLVVEAKKSTNPDTTTDHDKLAEFLQPTYYKYRVGLFVMLHVGTTTGAELQFKRFDPSSSSVVVMRVQHLP